MLRGINVGSARRVGMPELRDALAEAGLAGARTYVQSGNIVVDTKLSPARFASAVEAVLQDPFELDDVPVIVRTRDQLERIVELDPLRDRATDDRLYQVSFLSDELSADVEALLMSQDHDPEALVIDGRELYSWHPGGVHSSKLARQLTDRKLGAVVTARNWKTVTALLALTG